GKRALVLILALGAAGGWVLAANARGVVVDEMGPTDPILLGAQNEVLVQLRNTNLWRSFDVNAVSSSCGRLTIKNAPSRIEARNSATVSFTAAPNPLLPKRSELIDIE